jgi:hypothetical protein
MKRILPSAIVGLLVATWLATGAGVHAQANHRPIQDWVNGQTSFPFGTTWRDPATNRTLYADYLGAANRWLITNAGHPDLGTTIDGDVTERELTADRTAVHVIAHTRNSLCWAADSTLGLLFGYNRFEVAVGRPASLGDVLINLDFINNKPVGGALPDFINLVFFPEAGQSLDKVSFVANCDGTLRAAFGVPEGTPGRARTTQRGLYGVLSGPDFFPTERIEIQRTGK